MTAKEFMSRERKRIWMEHLQVTAGVIVMAMAAGMMLMFWMTLSTWVVLP